nr:ATP-binding cassette domain-containing protein [Deltaproteobacteria bacterium]
AVTEPDLRAFGSRFGAAEEAALRNAVREELDLRGFAERYGSGESLLLLDALFAVCAVDGVIDRAEIGRLTRSAGELGIDPQLVGALFRKHDRRRTDGTLTFELTDERYAIGRSTSADIHLADPQAAERHADLVRTGGAWRVIDLGSGRPTLLNGTPISAAPLAPGDELRIGGHLLVLGADRATLRVGAPTSFSALSVRHLDRKIGNVTLLDDVSFTVFTGEVIAVVGPSGAGKTTLLSAITGSAPADDGDVVFDGRDFHDQLALDPSLVGIVPQDDVVHAELTVEEALSWAARLRTPRASEAEIQANVERVLGEMDIVHIRASRIGDAVRRGISGGQRKRVNVGQELLGRSTRVLFLDEPTSGLDPNTAQEIVGLVRRLADDGRIVFLVTHDVSPSILAKVDHLLVLARGGRVAWFGPPDEAMAWFGVTTADGIFGRLSQDSPEAWSQKYRDGASFRKFVRTREHLLGLDGVDIRRTGQKRPRSANFRHYLTLTNRYARVKVRDRAGLFVLLAQPPFLAVAMWLVFQHVEASVLFMLALSSLWFGASASVRELISERPIWRRDARTGVGTLPYLLAKLTVLGAIATLQCSLLAAMNWVMLRMYAEDYAFSLPGLMGVASLTGWVGMAMGLLLSAVFASSEGAVGMLPLLIIPQITFGGLLVKLKDMGPGSAMLAWLIPVRFAFDALIRTGERLDRIDPRTNDPILETTSSTLWQFGFRTTTDVNDAGVPMSALIAILLAFCGLLLVATAGLVHRSRAS